MNYICDGFARHLICIPYSIKNLHLMAEQLGIKRCWFHSKGELSHYDIPKRRIKEIMSKCTIVSTQQLIKIMRNE